MVVESDVGVWVLDEGIGCGLANIMHEPKEPDHLVLEVRSAFFPVDSLKKIYPYENLSFY
jgi:hypothetical protein